PSGTNARSFGSLQGALNAFSTRLEMTGRFALSSMARTFEAAAKPAAPAIKFRRESPSRIAMCPPQSRDDNTSEVDAIARRGVCQAISYPTVLKFVRDARLWTEARALKLYSAANDEMRP